MRPQARHGALDGLRGIAALGVLVLHVWMFDYGDAHRPPKTWLDHAIGELRLGVVLFFVLSGYLLYRPFVAAHLSGDPRPSLRVYAARRAARILPAYWFAVAGAFALESTYGWGRGIDADQLWLFLTFGQNYSTQTIHHLDAPLWTLGVEVAFYAVLPLIALAAERLGARRRDQLVVPLGLVAVALGMSALNAAHPLPPTLTSALPLHIGEFACGMAVAAWRPRWTPSTGLAAVAAGTALVTLDAVWHSFGIGEFWLRVALADLPAAVGFALIVAGLIAAPRNLRVLRSPPLQALGALSYAIYLWHFIVITALRGSGRWPDDLGHALADTLLGTLAIAAVSWFALERPVLTWSRAVGSRRGDRRGLRPQAADG